MDKSLCMCPNEIDAVFDLCTSCLQSLRKEEKDIVVGNFDLITEQVDHFFRTTQKLWIGSGEDAPPLISV